MVALSLAACFGFASVTATIIGFSLTIRAMSSYLFPVVSWSTCIILTAGSVRVTNALLLAEAVSYLQLVTSSDEECLGSGHKL